MTFDKKYSKQSRKAYFWVYQVPSGGFFSRDKRHTDIPQGWEGLKKITSTSLVNAKRFSSPSDLPPHSHDGLVGGRWVKVELVSKFTLLED